jgi:ABC-type antimicrobial peptide transport system permease subunit
MHDDAEGVSPSAAIIVRTSASVDSAAKAIRAAIAEIDAGVPVSTYTMDQRLGELVAQPRFNAALTAGFALAGTLLAAIGLYGVLSFIVVQRHQEVGVRLALGATSQDIVRLILSGAMRWTAFGVALGLVGSFFATRLLRSLLFQVEASDLWTPALTVCLMFGITLLAAGIPALRASRTDAVVVLKHD